MKINLKKWSSKILKGVAILFLLFMFANFAVSTAQAQETEKDYKLLWSYKTGGPVDVSVSSDGSYIAAGSDKGKVYLFNRKGKVLWSYKTGDIVGSVSVSSDGSYIAAGSRDDSWWSSRGMVYFFNRKGELLWRYKTGGTVEGVSVSSDGSYIAAGSRDDKVYFFNREGKLLWSYRTGDTVTDVSVSFDGSYIAAGSWGSEVYFFNRNGDLLWSCKTGQILGISVSSDGSYVAAGSWSKVYFFNRNGDLLWSYGARSSSTSSASGVSVSSDSSYVAAGSLNSEVYLFNREGKVLWISYDDINDIRGVSISSDGSYIAAGFSRYYTWGQVYYFIAIEKFVNAIIEYIEEAKGVVESDRAKGFNITEAENLLSQAEQAFNAGDYERAMELADECYFLAIDIDQDGVLNEEDFAPTIKNNYIYAGGVVLTAAFTGAGFVFSRNRKKRKEYRARVREYRAKVEQWKREGYDVLELERMLR